MEVSSRKPIRQQTHYFLSIMHSLHLHLRKSLSWYNNWHNDRLHRHAHWALFLVIATLLTSFISQGIRDFYFEGAYKAEAQNTSRVITAVSPDPVVIGQVFLISGTNLSSTVQFFDSSNNRSTYVGTINADNTQVSITIPADLTPGPYTVRVGPTLTDFSNIVSFTLANTGPTPAPSPSSSLPAAGSYVYPPVISFIYPDPAKVGERISVQGTDLNNNVHFIDSSGNDQAFVGNLNSLEGEVTLTIPSALAVGSYKVKIGPTQNGYSNSVDFQVAEGAPEVSASGTAAILSPITTKDLGPGTFPDIAWFRGRIWLMYQPALADVRLYSFAPDLTDQRLEKIFPLSPGSQSFPRLIVFNNILWAAYRDGGNTNYDLRLWRSDSDTEESLGFDQGNFPHALGAGYIFWQEDLAYNLVKRGLASGTKQTIGTGQSSGLAQVDPDGNIKFTTQILTEVSWGYNVWYAGPLAVVEELSQDNGLVGHFNDDPATEFRLWTGEVAHNHHAVFDGNNYYAVTTWNPTVRIATFAYGSSLQPLITDISPLEIYPGDSLEISGEFLGPYVNFIEVNTGAQTNVAGWVDSGREHTNVLIPSSILPGLYNVGITTENGSATSQQILSILEGASEVQAAGVESLAIPTAPGFQDLLTSLYNYSLVLVGLAVFIMILWGGFLWLTSAANPGNIGTAKKYITNAIIGAVLLAASYVILNTINPELIRGTLDLPGLQTPTPLPSTPTPTITIGPGTQINACTQCNAYPGGILAEGQPVQCTGNYLDATNFNPPIPINDSSRTCPFVEVRIGPKLIALRGLATNWVMSEGFPPTINHAEACHGNGTCIDIVMTNRPSNPSQAIDALNLLCRAIKQAGFTRIVNEYSTLINSWPNTVITECPPPRTTTFQTGDNLHIE